ncbi:MAG: multifunctional oxoglutarate decarboxylase/oxoglutarate dehydrogenase thiamine pyrophosphate-binding subunit/dihydrolipoyllysine-residue succinyltransferase subunit [Candidatus Nanopelagicales bacterium]|nr:multifunctional oxoglutarate decarboxylase/oxoglutarate dehydrogenase thiamine pyrophosphate-binding subunit/dihydrolipoyllysine-residue succinyltransferase subunit [Candidatus Nanopelagicales bacterium]
MTQGRFGPNEWLVDEIYQQYLTDRASVDPAWWDFFADYSPADGSSFKTHLDQVNSVHSAPERPQPTSTPTNPPADSPPAPQPSPVTADVVSLRGPAARVVTNMEASLAVPTATSVRGMPVKLLVDNRTVINNHLARGRGGKVSFTHLIGYAIVRAISSVPAMNNSFAVVDGKPAIELHDDVNLGIAIDLVKADGSRQLLVPCIKGAQVPDFAGFWAAYEDIVRRARTGALTADDFAGTTISLTNPGTIGTEHSVPRLMQGQGCIVGVGAMEYPAEWQGASEEVLVRNAVSKTVTLTSTYDHRIIQGAQSGEFLRRIHQLLLGEDDFYGDVFRSLRIPYEPIRWAQDFSASHETDLDKTVRVQEVIHAFRVRGHLMADTNPLEYEQRMHPDLDVLSHKLTLWDLDREFATGGFAGRPLMKLREILGVLRDSYTRSIGIEYMHIQDPEQRAWIQERVEIPHHKPSRDEQLRILHKLNEAEAFETFLQTKYVGQKRFSLEGSESLIPLMDAVLSSAAHDNIIEVAIGMPHRGRLNVLTNIAGKSYAQIFAEFEGNYGDESVQGSGDVKYHLGTSGTYRSLDGHETLVYVAANPSHLEAVDPVLEGIVRAKQDLLPRDRAFDILPLLLHGDAAFAGQGVVAETLNLSQLQGYRTGGTVHVVVNNQVGFTTSPRYSRSSVYSTDVARMIQAPIFHVNGDDPEAVVRVARLAFEFRQAFAKDVVIDLVTYRRRGHNEADDPSLTQPLMYELIDAKRSVRKHYTESLIGRGDITLEEAEEALRHFQEQLEGVFQDSRGDAQASRFSDTSEEVVRTGQLTLSPMGPAGDILTGIDRSAVDLVVESQLTMPDGFTLHPRLAPQLQRRAQMVADDAIDWGMGEALAIGSLLLEGRSVRLAGQDSRRGTFGHRHAVIVDRKTGWQYKPLKRCYRDGAKLWVYDSLLSEFAAVGFEYGYSVARTDALVMWEAQFGDFVDGAQTIIDEFISSGEQKWNQRSSLVLLLPHGYEGQGPDHSSARVERFLQLCAEDNMTVAMPSTPASYFHLLRWQVHSPFVRPLIIFTPKSLLRAKFATSPLSEFLEGSFRPVIPDTTVDPAGVERVLLCSGKVYYDLVAERAKRGDTRTAIVRLERLYPLPWRTLPGILGAYPPSAHLRWVQEEPANQGAWSFMAINLPGILDRPLEGISRPASSSPAVGSHHRHDEEQHSVVQAAFA